MSDSYCIKENKLENVFLSERFLTVIYIFMIVAGFVSLFFLYYRKGIF